MHHTCRGQTAYPNLSKIVKHAVESHLYVGYLLLPGERMPFQGERHMDALVRHIADSPPDMFTSIYCHFFAMRLDGDTLSESLQTALLSYIDDSPFEDALKAHARDVVL